MELSHGQKSIQIIFLVLVGLVIPIALMLQVQSRIEFFALIIWFVAMFAFSFSFIMLQKAREVKAQEIQDRHLHASYEETWQITREIGNNMTGFSGYISNSPEPGLLYLTKNDDRYRLDIKKVPTSYEEWQNQP